MLIKIMSKPRAGNRKKAKTVKTDGEFGPVIANTRMIWSEFLSLVAKEMGTADKCLAVASMKWRWMKPATAEMLPLTSANGYSSMLKQISASKAESPYIFLFMDPPSADEPLVMLPLS